MRRILTLAFANTAASLHYYLIAYVASSYLGLFLPDAQNGLVFSVSALFMILGFAVTPFLLVRFSVRRIAFLLAAADLATLLLLTMSPSAPLAISLIALQGALAPLIAYTLDLLLENATLNENETGAMRGLFLTAGNVALVGAPLLAGVILDQTEHYAHLFFAAAVALAIFMGLLITRKRHLADLQLAKAASLAETLRCILADRETRSVIVANTMLQCFFIWEPVYIPLYLHLSLGMPWDVLGPLFALMLVPYLLIELPMGFLEDRFRGGRLVMTLGFVVLAVSLAAFALVGTGTHLLVIAAILVAMSVGAALIEITAQTSFFRNVGGKDAETVSFFRMTRPLGMLVGPVIGSFLLGLMPLEYVFIPLGALTLLGIPFALKIRN
jgi:MFS family permease